MFKINIDIVFKLISALLIILFVLIQTYNAGVDSVRAELRDEYQRTLQLEADNFKAEFKQYKDATTDAQTRLNRYWQGREADAAAVAVATSTTAAKVEVIKHEKVNPIDNCIVSNTDIGLLKQTVALIERPIPGNSTGGSGETANKSTIINTML